MDTARFSSRIELNRVAAHVRDLSIADNQIQRPARDSMRVLLILKRLVQQMVDVAILYAYIPRIHLDTVALAIANGAVSQHNVIREDADEIVLPPFAIHEEVFVNARLGNAEFLNAFRVRVRSDPAGQSSVFRGSSAHCEQRRRQLQPGSCMSHIY